MLLFNKPKEASSKKFMPGIDHEVSEGKQGRIVLAEKIQHEEFLLFKFWLFGSLLWAKIRVKNIGSTYGLNYGSLNIWDNPHTTG